MFGVLRQIPENIWLSYDGETYAFVIVASLDGPLPTIFWQSVSFS
jgi:hypothetical protein